MRPKGKEFLGRLSMSALHTCGSGQRSLPDRACPTTPLWIVLRRRNCSPELLLALKTRKVVNVAGAEPCLPPANFQGQSFVCLLARDSQISNLHPLPSLTSSATIRLRSFYYSIGFSTSRRPSRGIQQFPTAIEIICPAWALTWS